MRHDWQRVKSHEHENRYRCRRCDAEGVANANTYGVLVVKGARECRPSDGGGDNA